MSNSLPPTLVEEKENTDNDRLSNLPEDIIINILSLMDTKDATQKEILSRRWRYMSTYLTSMHFHHDMSLDLLLDNEPEWVDKEKQKYTNWVYQALSKHQAPFINDFQICLPFDSRYTTDVDNWIAFALSKRVKNLELNFAYAMFHSASFSPRLYCYSLPSDLFDQNHNNHLTSISLRCIDINDTVLELVLRQCHALEKLYIERATRVTMISTSTSTSSKKLKYLAILDCKRLSQVYIDAASLESFEFSSLGESSNNVVIYASVPSLVEARFRWLYRCTSSLPAFLHTKCFPTHLSKLSLHMTMKQITVGDLVVPCFPNVKYLELQIDLKSHRNLVPLMSIAEACPILEDFKLQLFWYNCRHEEVKTDSENESTEPDSDSAESDSDSTDSEWETESSNLESDNESADAESDIESAYEESDSESAYDEESDSESAYDEESDSKSVDAMSDSDSKLENESEEDCSLDNVKHWLETKEVTNATLPYLRKLKWSGAFSVHDNLEVQLALYCVKNAINLEIFICDPRDLPSKVAKPGDIDKIVEGGRRRARRLATVIPSHIQYVIL